MNIINDTLFMWNEGIAGKCILVLMAIVFVVLFAMIIWFLYWAVDSWFVSKQTGVAKIVSRRHRDAYTTMMPMLTGKTTTLIPQYHPEAWYFTFKMDNGKTDEVSVSSDSYKSIKNGQICSIEFKTGRLSESLYITSFKPI